MPSQAIRLLPFVRVAAHTCFMAVSYGIVTQMQRTCAWICRFVVGLALMVSSASAEDITVFAASSLRDAVNGIAEGFEAETGATVTLVFAASSSIARQVVQGAPADVVLLADYEWADWVAEQGTVEDFEPFAANRLVLVSVMNEVWPDLTRLPEALSDSNLAMAQVNSVPAGRYGKAALETLGLWENVSPKVVQAANVRAALRFVERGEAAFGIGYASDLVALPTLNEVYGFAETTHPPIQYFGASVTPSGLDFMAYVQSAASQEVLAQWGFPPVEAAQ